MIAASQSYPLVLRLSATFAWRSDRRIATKLHGFALTEQGSALDMFRAAEAATDPQQRRLFLRHALDEARHARRFRDAALALVPDSQPRAHERHHALPQDLYANLGTERFLAFVHLSEAQAHRQFIVLAGHFERQAERHGERFQSIARLFNELAREEQFHVAYSRHLLGLLYAEEERERRVAKALSRERRALAWAAWKRAGVRLGGRFTTLLMLVVFVAVLPLFALITRLTGGGLAKPGWHASAAAPHDYESARRQA